MFLERSSIEGFSPCIKMGKAGRVPLALRKIEKGIQYIGEIFTSIGEVLFVALMLLGAGDVIGRYVFNKPIAGTMEISEVLMAGMVFLSWAYTQRTGGHVRVELVISRYSAQARAIANFVTLFLALVLFSAIVWQSAIIAMKCVQEHRILRIVEIPVGPFYFLVPVGAFFLCLEFIIHMVHLVPQMRRGS
jgi:TRAP-type C4-dicarboxylate transport system permease small subunit